MKTQIIYNPKCSKSRKALGLLKEYTEDIEIIEYLKGALDAGDLERILKKLDCEPLDIIRTKEKEFKEKGYSAADIRPEKEWIQIMLDSPRLIERPIVIHGEKAIMGRPPELVHTLF